MWVADGDLDPATHMRFHLAQRRLAEHDLVGAVHGMARDDGRGEQWPYVGDLCDRVDHPALDAHRVLDPGTELGDVRVAEQSRHDGRDRAARVLDLEVEGTAIQARRIEEGTEARAGQIGRAS